MMAAVHACRLSEYTTEPQALLHTRHVSGRQDHFEEAEMVLLSYMQLHPLLRSAVYRCMSGAKSL